jgi:hypothetical protein
MKKIILSGKGAFYNYLFVLTTTLGAVVGNNAYAQQAVNDGTVPVAAIDPNAIAEFQTLNKGILLPRIALDSTTLPSPLTAHRAGMFLYNTASIHDVEPGTYYNNGTRWIKVSTANDAWQLQGNSGTIAASTAGMTMSSQNYIGTSDAKNVTIGVNKVSRAIFTQDGSLFGGAAVGVPNATYNAYNLIWGANISDSSKYNLVTGNGHSISTGSNFTTVSGNQNTVEGLGSVVAGSFNHVDGSYSTVTGTANSLIGTAPGYPMFSAMAGANNLLSKSIYGSVMGSYDTVYNSHAVFVVGQSNMVSGATGAAIFGSNNADSAVYSFINGFGNVIRKNASYGTAIGCQNTVGHLYSMALGKNAVTTASEQLVLGFTNGVILPKAASAPMAPTEGQAYYDTALHKLRVWDGTVWQNAW